MLFNYIGRIKNPEGRYKLDKHSAPQVEVALRQMMERCVQDLTTSVDHQATSNNTYEAKINLLALHQANATAALNDLMPEFRGRPRPSVLTELENVRRKMARKSEVFFVQCASYESQIVALKAENKKSEEELMIACNKEKILEATITGLTNKNKTISAQCASYESQILALEAYGKKTKEELTVAHIKEKKDLGATIFRLKAENEKSEEQLTVSHSKEKELESTIFRLKAENEKTEEELMVAHSKEKELEATIFRLKAENEEQLTVACIKEKELEATIKILTHKKTCCSMNHFSIGSKEPSLNNDASGLSKCEINKDRLNFSPSPVQLRRDGKVVQAASAIVAKAMQAHREKLSSTTHPIPTTSSCSSDQVFIDLLSDGEEDHPRVTRRTPDGNPCGKVYSENVLKKDSKKKDSKKEAGGPSKRKEPVTESPFNKRSRSDDIDNQEATLMAARLKKGEGLLNQMRATIHGESSCPDLVLTPESSVFKSIAGQDSFKLYEQCLLPYDQLGLIGHPISQLEEAAAHNAMMNLAILRHLTLTSVLCRQDLSQSQKKLTKLEAEVADQAIKMEKLNEEKEILTKGLESSMSEIDEEAFNKGRAG